MREITGLKDGTFVATARRLFEIKCAIDAMTEEQKRLREELLGSLVQAEVKNARVDNFLVSIVEGRSAAKFDKDKLRKLLLEEGVEVTTIARCFAEATTAGRPWTSVGVRETQEGEELPSADVEGVAV